MIGPDVLEEYRAQLARLVSARTTTPACDPLCASPWIAMSALQKAVRRGQLGIALQAAATLLVNSPERLWRRSGGIAFEDVGIADLETVGIVTASLGGKRVRAPLGGEWAVASLIVEAMVTAPKCRAADDLLMTVELHPRLAEARRAQAELSIHQLRRVVLSPAPFHERALALWFVLGTDHRPSRHLPLRRGEPAFAFDLLEELGTPPTLVEIAREGFRRTRETLPLLVGLLLASNGRPEPAHTDDETPSEVMVGPVPGWALDVYTREGRTSIARYVASKAGLAAWVREHVAPSRRVDFVGGLLFRVEGQVTRRRLRWGLGDELLRLVDLECQGFTSQQASDLLGLLREDIPHLNRVRAEVTGGQSHAG